MTVNKIFPNFRDPSQMSPLYANTFMAVISMSDLISYSESLGHFIFTSYSHLLNFYLY